MKTGAEPEFFLYGKTDCSACDEFKSRLDEEGISYHLIDIDGDPEMMHRYGARIPVLVAGNLEVCEGIFNYQAIQDYLASY